METSKEQFIGFWGTEGYEETYDGYPKGAKYFLSEVLNRYHNSDYTVLDIGCGNCGQTQQLLVPRFGRVLAVDVIPTPAKLDSNITFYEVGNKDYSLSVLTDESVDFVWSFGCFCHLTNSAVGKYLKSIYRVLKPNRKAVLTFANWSNHQYYREMADEERDKYREQPNANGWCCCDFPTVQSLAKDAGFVSCVDLLTQFRDTIVELRRR